MLTPISTYLVAMSIGLFIGLERERHFTSNEYPMGMRSFLLFSLLGAVAGSISEPLIALALVFFASAAILIGYLRTTEHSKAQLPIGLTTEIASMITFSLGYFCNYDPILSVTLGAVTYLVLSHKSSFHIWTKERLKPKELQAAAILVLLAIGVIPILPDKTIDPFHIFNPRRLGLIISLIAAIQFLGYAAGRIFGSRIGMPLAGFLAGTISSTAAFISYSKLAVEKSKNNQDLACAAAFAIVASLLQLLVLLFIISWPLARALLWPFALLILIAAGSGVLIWRQNNKELKENYLSNPLNLLSAIKLGALLTALIFIVELAERLAGEALTKIVAFVGALFNLQGVGVATANMFENKAIALNIAADTILVALSASFISKLFLTIILSPKGDYQKLMLKLTSALLAASVILCFVLARLNNASVF